LKTNEPILSPIATRPAGHGHESVNFGDQEVKDQEHKRPKIDLEDQDHKRPKIDLEDQDHKRPKIDFETWQRHHYQPL